jgi:hypothetical protein
VQEWLLLSVPVPVLALASVLVSVPASVWL